MKIFTLFIFVLLVELAFSSEFNNAQKQYLGAENILKNPGFENGKTAWTLTNGTLATESIIKIAGSKSLKATLSSQALELYQDSSLYASQFNGSVQGLGYIRIKTQVTGLKVCARKAGVIQTSLCIDVQANNEWGLYKIPFILGGTSNGLAVTSDGVSVTGDVYLDDAFVGAVDISADVDQSRIAGESFFAGTAGCLWTRASTSLGPFTVDTDCPGPTVANSSMGNWQTTDSDLPRQTVNNLPAGKYKAKFIGVSNINVSGSSLFAINDGTSTCNTVRAGGADGQYTPFIVECTFEYVSSGDRVFELYTTSTSGLVAVPGDYNPFSNVKFILEYFGSGSIYTSNNADTDWQSCQFSTLTWQGLGTVNASGLMCKRQGSDLLIEGLMATGVVSASQAQFLLPTWNGSQLVVKSSAVPSQRVSGRITRSNSVLNNGKDYVILISGNNNYFNYSLPEYAATFNPLTSLNGNAGLSNSDTLSIQARIPIQGWENSNIIIGQFNGLESCTDSYECTDTFSAKVSATGVVSGENIDWIDGNCSISSNVAICTPKALLFSVLPNCAVTRSTGNNRYGYYASAASSPSSLRFTLADPATGNNVLDADMSIICQKQGADYIGKTAKAVASDQNVRSIGAVGVDIQSVYFGSGASCLNPCNAIGSCTVCTRVGSKISSVEAVNTTGFYRLNGIDGTKYICNGQGLGASSSGVITHELGSSTSTYAGVQAWNAGSGAAQGRASITCVGIP